MKKACKVIVHFFCLMVVLFNLQCKKITQDPENENTKLQELVTITEQDILKFGIIEYALSDQAESITENWSKFIELSIHIEDLKKGQLTFFKDDKTIMQGLLTDLRSEIPEQINKPSILVRISVLETTMSKLDETANIKSSSKELLLNNIKDVLLSFNNFVYQINKEIEKDSQIIIKPS